MTHPKPYVDPPQTKVLLRIDLTPPEPVVTAFAPEGPWLFSGEPVPPEFIWNGEGDRCEASFPPTRPEGSVQCELVASHLEDGCFYHWSARSSV